jgi:hypothetical protein
VTRPTHPVRPAIVASKRGADSCDRLSSRYVLKQQARITEDLREGQRIGKFELEENFGVLKFRRSDFPIRLPRSKFRDDVLDLLICESIKRHESPPFYAAS